MTPLMCIIFEIFVYFYFYFAAFAFTRFWFAGLFTKQAQGWFVRSLGKEVEARVCTRSLAWATNIWTTCGEELVHTFHFLTLFLLLFFFSCFFFWMFLSKEYVHALFKFVSFLILFCWLVFLKICFAFRFGARNTSCVWGYWLGVASIFTKPSEDI